MLYFALAEVPTGEPPVCSECGKPASVRSDDRLLCSTCALRELSEECEEQT